MAGRLVRLVAAASAIGMLAAGSARADDPPFVPWTSALPPLAFGHQPGTAPECPGGEEACVHAVIDEMYSRFSPLAASCDHDAVFALTYLRTTEAYHAAWHEPGFFADPAFLNHYDAVFAAYYFRASDAWASGNPDDVPVAWRIAFDEADNERVSGIGNLLLGMSAHINRDLPYVIEAIGLVSPGAASRKPDHDKVNEFLNRISDELFPELAARFDPTIDDGDIPGTLLDNFVQFQVIPAWREQAWRNAERLRDTPSAARFIVEDEIETWAARVARGIATAFAYGSPLVTNTAAHRDAHCAASQ